MKFSEAWLREWVSPNIDTQQLVDQLTMAGLEVDAVEPVAGQFSGVVVGEILSVEPHPDADKLRVCQVAGGEVDNQVVCGAPNARVGIKIPFALVGAKLPGNFKIKKAKLRGVESFGMLCAQTELEAGDDDDGLWELPGDAPTGTDLREYLSLNDNIIEVDLTPNRSDCLSLQGLAREVGVLNKAEVAKSESVSAPALDGSAPKSVSITAAAQCGRYVGRHIKGIDISKPTPLWMQEKLRRSGIRSIDAVVDVTNYVLLELGQPMHAFDLNKVAGGIDVRLAEASEKLTLLDGQEVPLKSETLVIADESGAIAMAGVMGGESTAVGDTTTDIFLESAFFAPVAIAGKARDYGLHTDSSHRFERGVDYNGCEAALERATSLLLDIVGGQAGALVRAESDSLPSEVSVFLRRSKIESGLGFAIPDDEVVDILTRLGLSLSSSNDTGWEFFVPSYRFDISIEADLLEELARIYGYNNLPTTEMRIPVLLPEKTETVVDEYQVATQLASLGYQEVITYSFIDPKIQSVFDKNREPVALMNPISADMGVMRTSLLPGLVTTLLHNLNRQKNRVRIFEKGMTFVPSDNGLVQAPTIAGLIYGPRNSVGWSEEKGEADFYDLKGDLESILGASGKGFCFSAGSREALHPGQTAEVSVGGELAGYIGALHPQVAQQLGISKPTFVFELELSKVLMSSIPTFTPLSRYPEVSRDLAIIVDKALPVAALESEILAESGECLKELKVFDVYSGEGIDPKRKSVAFNLTFQHPSRTLNEEEINNPMASIVKRLEEKFDAKLR